MRLELHRIKLGDHATLGNLYVDGALFCHTLEDVVRDLGPDGAGKVYGETAIPAGTYEVILNLSQRFGRVMPRLVGVPFFTGILIHKGNTAANTHGCILVGDTVAGPDRITHSTEAFERLFPLLQRAQSIDITITDDFRG